MNIDRIAKQLQREALRSPKKAGILGVLAIVACYYWAPLVGGWFMAVNSTETMAMAPESREKPFAVKSRPRQQSSESNVAAPHAPSHTWQEIVRKIEQDPFTRAVPPTDPWRDPFHLSLHEAEEPEKSIDPEPKTIEPQERPKWTPQSFNMELVGTAKGNQTGMVMLQAAGLIVGTQEVRRSMFSEGDTIHLVKEDRQVVFVLTEVHPRYIVLRHENKTFELSMPQRKFAGLIRRSTGSN